MGACALSGPALFRHAAGSRLHGVPNHGWRAVEPRGLAVQQRASAHSCARHISFSVRARARGRSEPRNPGAKSEALCLSVAGGPERAAGVDPVAGGGHSPRAEMRTKQLLIALPLIIFGVLAQSAF